MLPKMFAGKFSAAVWVFVILATSVCGAGQADAQVVGATLTNNTDIFDSTGAANGSAGLLTSTPATAREIQFALKFTW